MIARAVFATALVVFSMGVARATTVKSDPSSEEIQKIIQRFAANEAAFAKARENYTYRQTARIFEYDAAGTPGGKFERVDEIIFTPDGKRTERATYAPVPTLRMIHMSAEDEEDLRHVMPFVLTTAEIDKYHVRYLGRQGTFTLSVANDGTVPTDNVRVMHKIPEGFQYVGSDRGAQYDPATRLLTWFVGRLDKGQTASMKVTLSAQKIGEFQHLVRATSETGSLSDVQLWTAVEGTSSLAMHVRDLEDPVEVGAQNVYEVVVKNDGSAAAKNIGIACELAPGMTFESAEGPAQHIVDNGIVVFRALPEIAPGQSAVFRVKVSVANPGTLRFRARLTSDSIEEPLTTEELTKFYGE